MQAKIDIMSNCAVKLTPQDLVAFEPYIKDALADFLPFSSYSLYFPRTLPPNMRQGEGMEALDQGRAVYIPEEKKVLTPLTVKGEFLGVFIAKGVRLKAPKTMLSHLNRIAGLCLEKLLLYKISTCDPKTGLTNQEHFLDMLAREIEIVKSGLRPKPGLDQDFDSAGFRAGLGIIYLKVESVQEIQRKFGYDFADQILMAAADAIDTFCPDEAQPARLCEEAFALLRPEGSPGICRKAAEEILNKLSGLSFPHPLTGQDLKIRVSVGAANYPQDMSGRFFEKDSMEQARILVDKARLASEIAGENRRGEVLAFSRVLREGGRIKNIRPEGGVNVNLGRAVNAREGQRFLVWPGNRANPRPEFNSEPGQPAKFKGEIALMRVEDGQSRAEVLHLSDPARPLEAGDRLTLAVDADLSLDSGRVRPEGGPDPQTALHSYQDFLSIWTRQRKENEYFTLALVRIEPKETSPDEDFPEQAEAWAAETAKAVFSESGADSFGGRLGLTSLLFYHPNTRPDQARDRYAGLFDGIAGRFGAELAVGLSYHPCLDFSKADCLENCRKALDYAMLLPCPRLGVFDSLAQTISADALFSQGDLYGAMEEYKRAILLDENNNLARNSLGVCLARLNRLEQARRCFEKVLENDENDIMAWYNLGHASQKGGAPDKAEKQYLRCLELEPGHGYSLIRLGQLAEKRNDPAKAGDYYRRAAGLEGMEGFTHRSLARLALAGNKLEQARDHLQQALIFDPKDAFALNMLAKLYLDEGEDPEIAEMLARQSVSLNPQHKDFWLELARAFEKLGKESQARHSFEQAARL